MTNKHRKRCSLLSVIREMQITVPTRYCTPTRMATLCRQVLVRMWRNYKPQTLSVEMQKSCTLFGKQCGSYSIVKELDISIRPKNFTMYLPRGPENIKPAQIPVHKCLEQHYS